MFVISTVAAYNLAAWFASEANDQDLLSSAHNVAARLWEDKNGMVAELPKNVQAVLRHNDRDHFYYQVLDEHNQRLTGDAQLPMPVTSTDTDVPRFRNAVFNGVPIRMARIRVAVRNAQDRIVIVQVARTLNAKRELLSKIFLSIVIPQAALCILSVAAVWIGVRRGLRPLLMLSHAIKNRSQSDLTPIAMKESPAEVVPLIDALNLLLSRLQTHIDAQQRFVANAAHQLRTPVAGLKAYIEYGRRVNNGKIKEVLDHLDNGTDRISELVAGLLVLARATDRVVSNPEPVELNALASEVASSLAREAASKQIDLSYFGSEQNLFVKGDRAQLREMLSNLVENGIRYTPSGGKVAVRLEAGDAISVIVSDTGPGIPEAERQRVFERFYRVLGTKVNGSGLGLAIVNEIAMAHNAQVELSAPQEGSGTVARVTFMSKHA